MSIPSRWRRLLLLVAVIAVIAAACGDSDSDAAGAPAAPPVADEPAPLPPNSDPAGTPPIGATCLEGEPDCIDTLDTDETPQDLPLPGDEPIAPTGMLVDGGLSVSEALTTDATGIIAVQGFLVVKDGEARLCELLAESFPPQCGGAELPITDYEEVLGVPLQSEQGVAWTDNVVSFLGEIVDGTLVVDPTVAQ